MMNRLRFLRNSLAVWFGSNARWTALVKLQANKKIYDFRFFFVSGLYPISRAKSKPTTWKGVILLSCLFAIFQLVGLRKR